MAQGSAIMAGTVVSTALLGGRKNYNTVGKRDDWHGERKVFIPSDKAVEAAFNQNWDVSRSNVCGSCFTARTTTGRCNCN